jgi:hypothetical protein
VTTARAWPGRGRWGLLAGLLLFLGPSLAAAETCLLRQSTAANVRLGVFVDAATGATPQTALTITQAETQLSKNAAAFAQKSETSSATHRGGGHYMVAVNAGDTDTLGSLSFYVNEANTLPVWKECAVIEAAAWDALFAGTGVGIRADLRGAAGTAVTGLHPTPTYIYAPDVKKGTPNVIQTIHIKSAVTGAPLPGLTNASAGLTLEYCRTSQGNTTCTSVTPQPMTRGTCTQNGFVEKDPTVGSYELCVENAAYAGGAEQVDLNISGVSGMAPTMVKIGLYDIGSADLATTLAAVQADTDNLQTRLPAALVDGRMDASVGALGAGSITAATFAADAISAGTIAADAIGASELAASAADKIGDDIQARKLRVASIYLQNVAGQPPMPIVMRRYNDGRVGLAGAALTVQVSIDGGITWQPTTGSTILEVGDGAYKFIPAAGSINCVICLYKATAPEGISYFWSVVTTTTP